MRFKKILGKKAKKSFLKDEIILYEKINLNYRK